MEIFENIYQKHKTAAHIVIFIISIIAYGLLGYAIGRNSAFYNSASEMKFIPDINPGVCSVDIDGIQNGVIRGHIGEKHVRIRYRGKVIITDNSGRFLIEY